MSTPFTTEDIETLPEWNAVLAAGCGCQMPACPVPQKVCQSMQRQSTSEDTEYSDALEAYEAALSAWLSELYDAWYEDLQAWLAEDPEREAEDYPVDPPEPRDEEDFSEYPGPTLPADYYDFIHGSFAPYARPAGDPDDEVPSLYRKYETVSATTKYTGDFYYYNPGEDGVGFYELLEHKTWLDSEGDPVSGVRTGNRVEGGICVPYTYDPQPTTGTPPFVDYIDGDEELECTANSRTFSTTGTSISPGRDSLVGCPGPWGFDWEESWDLTRVYSYGHTLLEPITKSELGTTATGKIPEEWTEEAEGASCIAKLAYDWPIIRDGFIGVDPEADPPEEGEWRTCSDYDGSGGEPFELFGWGYATKSRFKWRVPSLIVPGVVTELDPDPDPLDWWRGDYFKVTWQTCVFPKEWEEWKLLWDEYEAAKEIYDEWVDGGSITPELPELPPEEPTHPGLQPTPPVLSEDFFEVWTGPGDPDDDASWLFPLWHELEVPTDEAENRVVNVRFYCYPDSPYGYAPQVTGEAYEPFTIPDPPPV